MQADFIERATILTLTAMESIQDELEDPDAAVPIGTRLEIAKFAADRIGHAPQVNTQVNINVDLSGRLERARKRTAELALAPPSERASTVPAPVILEGEFTEVKGE
jgi:hypothetical protein